MEKYIYTSPRVKKNFDQNLIEDYSDKIKSIKKLDLGYFLHHPQISDLIKKNNKIIHIEKKTKIIFLYLL